MKKLSIAIVAFNEEKHIREALKSAAFADEIVLVDGRSSDKTASIAKKMGAEVYEVENQPLMKKMMNQAFSKCTGDWIFQLDADERITPELANEIIETINSDAGIDAYSVPRKNWLLGKWMEHTGWYPDYQLRLFQRGKAKYPAENVHEEVIVDGLAKQLSNHLEHINWESVSQFLLRFDSYTTYEAEKLIADGRKLVWTDAIKFPFSEFLTRFFAQEGYKDGLHGLVLSLLMAFYWEIIFAKVWEREGFWEYGGADFLNEVGKETTKISRAWSHWIMISEKNPARRYWRKLGNKLHGG